MAASVNIAAIFEETAGAREPYPAYIYKGKEITGREMIDTSRRLARGFRDLGVRPDDRVVFLLPNSPELVASYLAVFRLGAVPVPVTVSLGKREIEHIFSNAEPRLAVARFESAPGARDFLEKTDVPVVRVDCEPGGSTPCYSDMIATAGGDVDTVPRTMDDLGVLIYTSGATGLPKGVMLTMLNLIRPGGRLFDNEGKRKTTTPFKGLVRSVLVVPATHAYGLVVMLTSFFIPSSLLLLERFDADAVLHLLASHRPYMFPGVPTMYRYMLDHPRLSEFDLSGVKVWLSGAAPLPKGIHEEWKEKVGAEIIQAYGLSETTAYVSSSLFGTPSRQGSIGRPGPGVEVKVVDSGGKDLARGEVGEVMVRGISVMKGYYRDREGTDRVLKDGWLSTGDMGYIDEDGYIFIVDRKKDMIIRGGFNIFPAEVEDVLRRHPAVAEVAVVGAPDAAYGESVTAFVEVRPGQIAEAQELKDFLKDQIAHYKVPARIHIRESLPRNFVGKVLRRELREEAKRLAEETEKG